MQTTAPIQCPFCGQTFEVEVDCTLPSQRFTTDCEVCCHPMEVSLECERGEIVAVSASAE